LTIQAVLLVGAFEGEDATLRELAASGVVISTTRRHGTRAVERAVEALWRHDGIRASEVLVVDACERCQGPPRSRRVSAADARTTLRALRQGRTRAPLPDIPEPSAWTIEVNGADPALELMRDSWLAMADGVIGTLGSPLAAWAPARREVLVAGVFVDSGPDSDLLRAPDWTRLEGELVPEAGLRRVLDLRTGLLHHEGRSTAGAFRAVTLSSRARPGLGALRAEGVGARAPRGAVLATDSARGRGWVAREGVRASRRTEACLIAGTPGGVAVAASQSAHGRTGSHRLERLAAYVSHPYRTPSLDAAREHLARGEELGFDGLLGGQRRAWARRWEEMGIRIDGDADLQRAVNFALFHLDSSIATTRQAPLGPRGLSGPAYKGHVFWDSEVFVLPFFAATRPAAARAMLAYRVQRLPAAQAAAREAGLRGAWFPWESAADGRDVTPPWIPGPTEVPIRVWTGERELHVVADIAWAAMEYVAWSGDKAFADRDARRLLIETARFWASRLEQDPDGSVHLRGIIGPDEYHELVDDNAYTNVMARWNLRTAAAVAAAKRPRARPGGPAARRPPGEPSAEEVEEWLHIAERIVDGYDPGTRIYEQFAGFHGLEPLRIAEMAPRPAWADALLGRERVARAQVVKQADVLLLHHLVPGETTEGSLQANLDYYEPRTAHGSSLSPATHAALLARAGRYERALDALHMAAFIDLDDRTGTASQGLHVQTMGGLWQALVMGFAGVRPAGDRLAIDPRLPPGWKLLDVPVRFRGRLVRVSVVPGSMTIRSSGPVEVDVPGNPSLTVTRPGIELRERDGRWYT
jgi:hypothetical protein